MSMMQGAWKVGLLVVVAAALFLGVYWFLGKSIFAPKTQTYYARFPDAGGIATGAAVLMAGVQVGHVVNVELKGPDRAIVALAVEEKVRIPLGSTAELPTALIGIGDRQINIVPPKSGWTAYEAPGATISGSKQSPLQAIIPNIDSTLDELDKTIASIRKAVESAPLGRNLDKLLVSTNQTVQQFGQLAVKLDATVTQNQAGLRTLLASGNRIMADITAVSGKLSAYLKSGKFEGQIDQLMVELDRTVKAGQKLVADMDAFVADPELKANMKAILANATKITESGTRVAADAETMGKNGVTITENTVELTKKVNALADEAKILFDRLKGAVDKLPKEMKFPQINAEASVFRETDPGRWRTDLDIVLPLAGNTLHIGMFDAFESNKINLQLGRSLGPNVALRYGVYAGKPGVGVDYRLTPQFKLRGDLFGANDPRFDLRARYDFGNGIFGWVGVDRIFRQNAPTIGIGIRR